MSPRRGSRGSRWAASASGVLIEAGCIGALGIVFALAANFLSPRGLPLSGRLPSPAAPPSPLAASPSTAAIQVRPSGTPSQPAATGLAARLAAQGLTLLSSNQVEALFRPTRGAKQKE